MNATTAPKNKNRAARPLAVPHTIATAKDAKTGSRVAFTEADASAVRALGVDTADFRAAVAAAHAFVAPALERVAVSVDMNAAQLNELEPVARRFRCTVPELIITLALSWLETDHDEPAVMGDSLTENLNRFADNGECPQRICVYSSISDLSADRDKAEDSEREYAAALLRAHGMSACHVRHARGELVDFDAAEAEVERLKAALTNECESSR